MIVERILRYFCDAYSAKTGFFEEFSRFLAAPHHSQTFTAVNLAISLSRYEAMRTVLMDMDMRNPSVADVLGARDLDPWDGVAERAVDR